MAIIENHPVKKTVHLALKYCKSDKIAERKSDEEMKGLLFEPLGDSELVIYKTFTTLLNQNEAGDVYYSFKRNMQIYGQRELSEGNRRTKDGMPILAWHYIQSFEGQVDAVTANEIGVKLAEKMFEGFPVQISTHTDKENTHNHIVVCAWANDGHKWNQDNRTYQAVREESDRLCDEYGLSVLEHTRRQRLVEWTDSDGQKHFFEPTDRKEMLMELREQGKISTDDIRSYRNSEAYQDSKKKEDSLSARIKRDIDQMIPFSTSYEHLLKMLRETGYKIRDKKTSGEWLAHITFIPPDADPNSRGKRDSALSGKDGYYTRENLTKIIAQKMLEHQREAFTHGEEMPVPIQDPVVMGHYDYEEIDMTRFDDYYRTERNGQGEYELLLRGEVERDIIRDTKQKHEEIQSDLIDNSDLDRVLKDKESGTKESRKERLVREIRENLTNLSFVEENKIYTYKQANAAIAALWKKQKACTLSLEDARKALRGYDDMLTLPNRLQAVKTRLENNTENLDYMQGIDYLRDSQAATTLETAIHKYGLDTDEGIKKFITMKDKREESIKSLSLQLAQVTKMLSEYQKCMEVLRRIDRERGNTRMKHFKDYDAVFDSFDSNTSREPEPVKKSREKDDRS